jgi:hypothetical protein
LGIGLDGKFNHERAQGSQRGEVLQKVAKVAKVGAPAGLRWV